MSYRPKSGRTRTMTLTHSSLLPLPRAFLALESCCLDIPHTALLTDAKKVLLQKI